MSERCNYLSAIISNIQENMEDSNTAALRRMAKGFAKIERYMHGQEPGIFELVIKWCETFLYTERCKWEREFEAIKNKHFIINENELINLIMETQHLPLILKTQREFLNDYNCIQSYSPNVSFYCNFIAIGNDYEIFKRLNYDKFWIDLNKKSLSFEGRFKAGPNLSYQNIEGIFVIEKIEIEMEMLSVCFSDSNINSFPILTKENKLKIWLPNQEVERVRRQEFIQYYLTNEINEDIEQLDNNNNNVNNIEGGIENIINNMSQELTVNVDIMPTIPLETMTASLIENSYISPTISSPLTTKNHKKLSKIPKTKHPLSMLCTKRKRKDESDEDYVPYKKAKKRSKNNNRKSNKYAEININLSNEDQSCEPKDQVSNDITNITESLMLGNDCLIQDNEKHPQTNVTENLMQDYPWLIQDCENHFQAISNSKKGTANNVVNLKNNCLEDHLECSDFQTFRDGIERKSLHSSHNNVNKDTFLEEECSILDLLRNCRDASYEFPELPIIQNSHNLNNHMSQHNITPDVLISRADFNGHSNEVSSFEVEKYNNNNDSPHRRNNTQNKSYEVLNSTEMFDNNKMDIIEHNNNEFLSNKENNKPRYKNSENNKIRRSQTRAIDKANQNHRTPKKNTSHLKTKISLGNHNTHKNESEDSTIVLSDDSMDSPVAIMTSSRYLRNLRRSSMNNIDLHEINISKQISKFTSTIKRKLNLLRHSLSNNPEIDKEYVCEVTKSIVVVSKKQQKEIQSYIQDVECRKAHMEMQYQTYMQRIKHIKRFQSYAEQLLCSLQGNSYVSIALTEKCEQLVRRFKRIVYESEMKHGE
uniref:Uncharacterized protein n=1 Tax=Musca domestica TaxID=7370 RepID=A0A1I8M3R1_MUSDO